MKAINAIIALSHQKSK